MKRKLECDDGEENETKKMQASAPSAVPAHKGASTRVLKGHTDLVTSVCYSPNGKCLASTSRDGTVRLWDPSTGQCTKTLSEHASYQVHTVCYSTDGKHFASGGGNNIMKIWDASTNKCVSTKRVNTTDVYDVCFSTDDKHIASGGSNDGVEVWDASTGQLVNRFAKFGPVYSICYSPDGKQIAIGGGNNHVYDPVSIFDISTGKCIRTIKDLGWVFGVCYSPDNKYLVCGGEYGCPKMWNVSTGRRVYKLEAEANGCDINDVCYSSDGKYIACGDGHEVNLWNASTGEWMNKFVHPAPYTMSVEGVCFSPDSKHLTSAGQDHNVQIYSFCC